MELNKKQQEMKRAIISIAPMIDVTNTHFRYFFRLISKRATLYTQMLHHGAVINNHKFVLPFNKVQHPIVLQLGGCNPKLLAQAAIIAQKYGYDQINLNVGCPSPRVQEGSFGACLMKEPQLVYQCMEQIQKSIKIPVTVKCRLGVDQFDDYQFAKKFVHTVSGEQKGVVKHFMIHARKAFLKGLNPAQNRNIPPLQYQKVYKLQQDFPNLKFTINGGVKTQKQAKQLLQMHNMEGVMIGRTAYENPYQLINIDQVFYGEPDLPEEQKSRKYILYKYAQYVQRLQKGQIFDQHQNKIACPCNSVLLKPLINMYNGERGCAKFRQKLSDFNEMKLKSIGAIIRDAADFMQKMKDQQIKLLQLKNNKSSESAEKQNRHEQVNQETVKSDKLVKQQQKQLKMEQQNQQIGKQKIRQV